MDEYRHLLNKLGIEYELIKIQLQLGNKKEADKKYNELLDWLRNNYFIERIPEGHDKNCEGTMCYCKSRAN